MKIAEINNRKSAIQEGMFSALKSAFEKPGLHKLAYRYFMQDFVEDAMVSLANGINHGWIDPNLTSAVTKEKPTYAQATGKESMVPALNRETANIVNSYIKKIASSINNSLTQEQKLSLVKELVNFMADRKGTPEWKNAFDTVLKVIKNSNITDFSTIASNLKAGKTMTEHWQIHYISKLLESVDLTLDDLGLAVITENKKSYIAETKYLKLDAIFENIVEATAATATSISDYMTTWFDKYMQGVNWRTKEALIMPIIKDIEKTYSIDGGKKAIEKLGSIAFDISGTVIPDGANDIKMPIPSKASSFAPRTAEELAMAAEKLKKTNPAEYTKYKSMQR